MTKKNLFNYFLGNSPQWFKLSILGFLLLNPLLYFTLGSTVTAWVVIAEFIFCLAMALKCYPLQSGGLIALEVLFLGITTPESMLHEVVANNEVILLLVLMVPAIFFMKPLLMFIFNKIFIRVKSKITLSITFVLIAAILSAFLDALTVTAVIISVGTGFLKIYNDVKSQKRDYDNDKVTDTEQLDDATTIQFKSFLRSLFMHALVGTALGGVCTLVGEPQNLLIGERMGWDFVTFFNKMYKITLPVLFAGVITTFLLEKFKVLDFGAELPEDVRNILEGYTKKEDLERTEKEKYNLIIQGVAAVFLITGLALHAAPVGFIGLGLIIFQTAFMGITDEHHLGEAFTESLPFASLLIVFFAIVAMIHDQHLFTPIVGWALHQEPGLQAPIFYVANGLLSAISDNVFVATVYINEVTLAYEKGTISLEQYEKLAVAINTGTNLPSVATPNGQAAFLFMLTSSLAPLIGLSYGKMLKMALPYTIVLSLTGLLCVILTL
jgi:NhaB family Na+:H+ antiporter